MSLSKLPDELFAQVGSHLDYDDIWSLMLSSRRIYNVMKSFKMDKIKIDYLDISEANNSIDSCRANISRSYKRYTYKNLDKFKEIGAMLKIIFEKISTIRILTSKDLKITNSVGNVLNENKAKIEKLSFTGGSVELGPAAFISFCQKFKGTEFSEVEFNDALWSDDVLCEIIPYTIIRREMIQEVKKCVYQITDRTLLALVGEDKVQDEFNIRNVRNSFTVPGIVNVLQKVRDRQIEDLNWNLGLLHKNQLAASRRYFDEDSGECGLYKIKMFDRASRVIYKLTAYPTESYFQDADDSDYGLYDDETVIYFAVAKR